MSPAINLPLDKKGVDEFPQEFVSPVQGCIPAVWFWS